MQKSCIMFASANILYLQGDIVFKRCSLWFFASWFQTFVILASWYTRLVIRCIILFEHSLSFFEQGTFVLLWILPLIKIFLLLYTQRSPLSRMSCNHIHHIFTLHCWFKATSDYVRYCCSSKYTNGQGDIAFLKNWPVIKCIVSMKHSRF